MSKVVLIVDSKTGALVDVAGNKRENGRYSKFAKRMMSLDANPTLDYGANGGKVLTISRGGGAGAGSEIKLVAETIRALGEFKDKDGMTMAQVASRQMGVVLGRIDGTNGEISVVPSTDEDGAVRIKISLDETITTKLQQFDDNLKTLVKLIKDHNYISKPEMYECLRGVSVDEDDDFETVRGKLSTLISRLTELCEGQSIRTEGDTQENAS